MKIDEENTSTPTKTCRFGVFFKESHGNGMKYI